jgi:hypothetical protein
MYEKKSDRKFLEEKRIKTNATIIYSNLNLVLRLKCLKGILFIKTLLMKIEVARRIFVQDIQEGCEVFIP